MPVTTHKTTQLSILEDGYLKFETMDFILLLEKPYSSAFLKMIIVVWQLSISHSHTNTHTHRADSCK
jgi:hypothetical protein